MRPADSGKVTAKMIFTIAILSALVFSVVKILPVYIRAFELQDGLREIVIQAMAGQRPSADAVRNAVLAKAADLDLPVKSDDVKIEITPGKVTINLDYTVPVDLRIYTLNLHFTPSADNRSLT
jgi:hypothetical protein